MILNNLNKIRILKYFTILSIGIIFSFNNVLSFYSKVLLKREYILVLFILIVINKFYTVKIKWFIKRLLGFINLQDLLYQAVDILISLFIQLKILSITVNVLKYPSLIAVSNVPLEIKYLGTFAILLGISIVIIYDLYLTIVSYGKMYWKISMHRLEVLINIIDNILPQIPIATLFSSREIYISTYSKNHKPYLWVIDYLLFSEEELKFIDELHNNWLSRYASHNFFVIYSLDDFNKYRDKIEKSYYCLKYGTTVFVHYDNFRYIVSKIRKCDNIKVFKTPKDIESQIKDILLEKEYSRMNKLLSSEFNDSALLKNYSKKKYPSFVTQLLKKSINANSDLDGCLILFEMYDAVLRYVYYWAYCNYGNHCDFQLNKLNIKNMAYTMFNINSQSDNGILKLNCKNRIKDYLNNEYIAFIENIMNKEIKSEWFTFEIFIEIFSEIRNKTRAHGKIVEESARIIYGILWNMSILFFEYVDISNFSDVFSRDNNLYCRYSDAEYSCNELFIIDDDELYMKLEIEGKAAKYINYINGKHIIPEICFKD